jgi:hypothetical protein
VKFLEVIISITEIRGKNLSGDVGWEANAQLSSSIYEYWPKEIPRNIELLKNI